MTEITTPDTPENSEMQETQVQFTPDDLVVAINLIDEAQGQGAFKGWESVQKAMACRARLLTFAQHWQNTIEQQRIQMEQEKEAALAEWREKQAKTPKKEVK